MRATGHAGWALLTPLIINGGIRIGLTTDTEAAAVAVVYALAVSLLIYRELRIKELPEMLKGAGRSSATILFLLAAAGPFSWLVAESQINHAILGAIRGIAQDPVIILLIVNGFLPLIGCLIEPLPAMVIFAPTLLRLGRELGIDPIQFRLGDRPQPDDRADASADRPTALRGLQRRQGAHRQGNARIAAVPRLVDCRADQNDHVPAARRPGCPATSTRAARRR